MVSLSCQSFIRVFKKVTSDSSSCTDTIKRTQDFDLVYFFTILVAVFQIEFTKSSYLHPLPWPLFFTSEHEMKVFRIVMFFLL